MKEHHVNSLNNFICGWYLDDTAICDTVIDWFTNLEFSPTTKQAVSDLDGGRSATYSSCDTNQSCWKPYLNAITPCVQEYVKKYPVSDMYCASSLENNKFNVQHYAPGEGFKRYHTERTGEPTDCFRNLVFMTYLNDVEDKGETEFLHQELKIKPEKGLTLIWPTDWTFTHRGIPSLTQEKYIATGWFKYDTDNFQTVLRIKNERFIKTHF
jgi:hypothetical protein